MKNKGKKLELYVRVTKNNYVHKGVIVSSVKATLLKRISNGSIEDIITDAEYEIPTLNLHNLDCGVYQLTTKNESYDIESGIVDDYDIVLVRAN